MRLLQLRYHISTRHVYVFKQDIERGKRGIQDNFGERILCPISNILDNGRHREATLEDEGWLVTLSSIARLDNDDEAPHHLRLC